MKHADAWQRLPDLLDDRDDPELLGHVRGCADCQRQVFLLGRVDRLLRDQVAQRRLPRVRRIGAAAALVAAVTVLLVLLVPRTSHLHDFTLRTASGQAVGHAAMAHADSRNVSLALTARGLPLNRRHVFVLWASDGRSSMEVGRFMVDRSGGCRVRFNLPATHAWHRFWISQPGNGAAVVAST